jgi:LPXTG-motif cell wall-anchored protein
MKLRRFIQILAVALCSITLASPATVSAATFDWELVTGTPPNSYWYAMTYGEGLFVAVGADYDEAGGAEIVTSPDGVTWTPAEPLHGINEFWSVVYGNGLFVATGIEYSNNYATTTSVIAVSEDGTNWTKTSIQNAKKLQVTFGEGLFVAVSDSDDTNTDNQILTSTDGINWTRRGDKADSQNWSKITYGSGKFVAVSTSFDVLTSDNGTTWTAEVTGPSFSSTPQPDPAMAMALTFGNGKFLLLSAVNYTNPNGSRGVANISTDAKTWTSVEFAESAQSWVVIGFDGSNFVGTYGDLLLLSQDGNTWTSSQIIHGFRWMALAYAHGLYVAVDDGGKIMTSGVFAPPVATPPTEETADNNASPTTTVATSTTVTAKVKKQDTLPETGNDSSTFALLGGLFVAGGLVLAMRRRILQ